MIFSRIKWLSYNAFVDFGNRYTPIVHKFSWESQGIKGGGSAWFLKFDGEDWEIFSTERELRIYIVRHVYQTAKQYLIPSELLYQAGLRYLHPSIWVDSWISPIDDQQMYRIIHISPRDKVDGFTPPANRMLVLDTSREFPVVPTAKKGTSPKKYKPLSEIFRRETKKAPPAQKKPEPPKKKEPDPLTDIPIFPEGAYLTPVDIMWRDASWEGRCWPKKFDEPDIMPDSEGFYILDV